MKRQKPFSLIFLIAMIFFLAGVPVFSRNDKSELESVHELAVAVESLATSLAEQTKIEPVDYADLKKMLPNKFKGFKQIDVDGERTSMFGFRISQAQAEYEGNDESRIEISIIDFGTVKGIAGKAMLAWMSAEIDNESDDGYEKTTEFHGYKAFEKYAYEEKDGELSVLIAERFLVQVDGAGVGMKDIKRAMDSVDLKKLNKLRDFGVPK